MQRLCRPLLRWTLKFVLPTLDTISVGVSNLLLGNMQWPTNECPQREG